MLRHCSERLAQLRAFRPLISSWVCTRNASSLHTDSDSDLEEAEYSELLRELQQEAARLGAGGLDAAQAAEIDALLLGPDAAGSDEDTGEQRLLQAGVVGVPNAGKSTLVNALAGTKVSAVSPKTNTTEHTRLGAFIEGSAQVVLYDTPGVVGPQHYKNPTHQRRVRSAWTVAGDCDLLLFLVDAHRQLQRPDPRVERVIADSCSAASLGMPEDWQPPPAVLVLNKVDAIPRPQRPLLLPLSDQLRSLRQFDDTFFISAKDGRGLDDLREFLVSRATPGEWTLEAGLATDRGEEEQALEVVREQLFNRLYKEVPYEIRLQPASCIPLPDGSVKIEIDVVVPQDSVRAIVVGSGGSGITAVTQAARQELAEMWGHPVHLYLRVKVDKKA